MNYYRLPVVIFAVLIGGLYVYAKSGGRFFAPGKPTPAVDSGEADPSLPRIEFMMGPKSAPTFLPDEPPAVQGERQPATPTQGTLLPGSKSAGVVFPESLLPAQGQPAPQSYPQPAAPNATAPRNSRLLPGSKSAILIDPNSLQPAQQAVQPAPPPPTNAAPSRTLLPGSKSRAVIDPEAFAPSTSNAAPRNAAPSNAAPRQQAAPPQPARPQQSRQLPANSNYAPPGVAR
jgi:hypothetical protein